MANATTAPKTGDALIGGFSVTVDLGPVLVTVGAIPPALIGALAERNIDVVSHHRLSMIKRTAAEWPGGRQAQQWLAARLHGYGRKVANPTVMTELEGESFAAGGAGDDPEYMKDLETGKTFNTRAPMAMPIGPLALSGGARAAARKNFIEGLAKRRYTITRSGYIVADGPKRTQIVGKFVKRRTQRPLLKFFGTWEKNWPKHSAKYDRALDLALTVAGQTKLEAEVAGSRAARTAGSEAYRKLIEQGLSPAEARKAMREAGRAARREAEQAVKFAAAKGGV